MCSGKEKLFVFEYNKAELNTNFLAFSKKCQVKCVGKDSGKLLSAHSDSVVALIQSHSDLDQKTVIPVFIYCMVHEVHGYISAFRR